MTGRGDTGGEHERAAQAARARERFTAIARKPDEQVDLAEAALLIAAEEYPGLDVAAYLGRLDELAGRVRSRLAVANLVPDSGDADETALAALHSVLFEEEAFKGSIAGDDYVRGSFLNNVLDHKQGLPITLSLVYCEVARRAGLGAVGVGLPNHFIAEFRGQHTSVLIDPFHNGQRIDRAQAAVLANGGRSPAPPLPDEFFRPVPRKRILARMLTNLKEYYRARGPLSKALAAVERILVVSPSVDQVRDRGLILAQMNMPGPAWFDLKLYARLAEGSSDAPAVSEAADKLWQRMGRMN